MPSHELYVGLCVCVPLQTPFGPPGFQDSFLCLSGWQLCEESHHCPLEGTSFGGNIVVLWKEVDSYYTHLTDKETEGQRDEVSCSRSDS